MLIGVPLGLVAGYYQGWASEAIMRVTDVFLAVPQLILALALAQLMGPSLQSAMLALSLTYWPFFTRIVYAEARRLEASLFIDALQCIGARRSAASCSCTSCPTASRPSSCAPPSAWASPSWSRPCSASSAWAPRRPTPDWGLAISESRAYLPRRLVVLDLPGARHLPHRARLQPAGRRPARHRRSPAEALAMSEAPCWR